MSVDPEKASRILDLLEAATRNGDLDQDEAASILSSWLAGQKRHSCGFPTSPSAVPPPLPPRPQGQSQHQKQRGQQQRRSQRRFGWRRWFADCVSPAAAGSASASAADADSQLPPPPPGAAGHEYALYGGPDQPRQAAAASVAPPTPEAASALFEEYEDCAFPLPPPMLASQQTQEGASNTADSGVFNW